MAEFENEVIVNDDETVPTDTTETTEGVEISEEVPTEGEETGDEGELSYLSTTCVYAVAEDESFVQITKIEPVDDVVATMNDGSKYVENVLYVDPTGDAVVYIDGVFKAVESTLQDAPVTGGEGGEVVIPPTYVHPYLDTEVDIQDAGELQAGTTFAVVESISVDAYGHVTAVAIKNHTFPAVKVDDEGKAEFIHPTVPVEEDEVGEVATSLEVVDEVVRDENGHVVKIHKTPVEIPAPHTPVTPADVATTIDGDSVNIVTGVGCDEFGHLVSVEKAKLTIPKASDTLEKVDRKDETTNESHMLNLGDAALQIVDSVDTNEYGAVIGVHTKNIKLSGCPVKCEFGEANLAGPGAPYFEDLYVIKNFETTSTGVFNKITTGKIRILNPEYILKDLSDIRDLCIHDDAQVVNENVSGSTINYVKSIETDDGIVTKITTATMELPSVPELKNLTTTDTSVLINNQLSVNGNAGVLGNLNVKQSVSVSGTVEASTVEAGVLASNTIQAKVGTAVTVAGKLAVNNGLTVAAGKTIIGKSGDSTTDVQVNSNILIKGATTINGGLCVGNQGPTGNKGATIYGPVRMHGEVTASSGITTGTLTSTTINGTTGKINSLEAVNGITTGYISTGGPCTTKNYLRGYTYLNEASASTLEASTVKASNLYGTLISSSDQAAKHDIVKVSDDENLALINKLEPVTYKYNNGTSDRTHAGFIAQDVEKAANELGIETKDFAAVCKWAKQVTSVETVDGKAETVTVDDPTGAQEYGLRYQEFIAPLVGAVKALTKRVEDLEAKVAELEK